MARLIGPMLCASTAHRVPDVGILADNEDEPLVTNCIQCGCILERNVEGYYQARPQTYVPPKAKDASACYFVWISVFGRPAPQKWWEELGTIVGGRSPVIAQHKLSLDEERLSLEQLATRYPAPEIKDDA